MQTNCPTCGYPRETFASDEGTSGFVPYKPVDSSQPIDIEKEVFDRLDPYKYYGSMWSDARGMMIELARSIATRVEEQTIWRTSDAPTIHKRIYSAPAALEKGETK